MPGTLIEESALRRSTLAHADAGNEYMFWRRLERYQRRFSTSLFARQFYMELMHKFVSWSGHEQKPDLVKLGVFLSSLPTEVQPSAYRTLARAAARASQVEITDYAATRLQDISTADSADDHISRLYGSIFSIATKNGQMAFAQLQSINQTYLQPDDQALLVAALSIAKDINQPTKYSVIRNLPPSAPSPLEVDADKMLEDVGRLLQQAKS
jgi:chemotaxis protein MotC